MDDKWQDLFPAARVVHLCTSCSDHCPLLIHLVVEGKCKWQSSPTYEIMWERDPTLPEVIALAWSRKRPSGHLALVAISLQEMMKDLKAWSKQNFGHVTRGIEKLRSELEALQLGAANRDLIT